MALPQPAPQPAANPVRILLIEDEPISAQIVAAFLAPMRWARATLETAATLREALARLRLEQFDLVITDLDLPDSRGIATLQAVTRACDRLIIVLTGNEEQGIREQALECGAYE
jgi:CheY-like chemotaxis protein